MTIFCDEDTSQDARHSGETMALCPCCGQKLFDVMDIFISGLIRIKCRRCKKYILVEVRKTSG